MKKARFDSNLLFKVEEDLRQNYTCADIHALAKFHKIKTIGSIDSIIQQIAKQNTILKDSNLQRFCERSEHFDCTFLKSASMPTAYEDNLLKHIRTAIRGNNMLRLQQLLQTLQNTVITPNLINDYPLLFEAIASGNLQIVIQLIHSGADPNRMFPFERGDIFSVLHFACAVGSFEIVDYLLKLGIPPDIRSKEHYATPLMYAAQSGL